MRELILLNMDADSGPVTAGCCEHSEFDTSPLRHMYTRITFVGP
jgi:hypothetical protein